MSLIALVICPNGDVSKYASSEVPVGIMGDGGACLSNGDVCTKQSGGFIRVSGIGFGILGDLWVWMKQARFQ